MTELGDKLRAMASACDDDPSVTSIVCGFSGDLGFHFAWQNPVLPHRDQLKALVVAASRAVEGGTLKPATTEQIQAIADILASDEP